MDFKETKIAMIDADVLNCLISRVEQLTECVKSFRSEHEKSIYSNSEVKELLGIGDKLIKKYRDEGWLGYSQVGDKFWYSMADIQQFMQSNYYPAFALAG